jgi:hypothetical protein
MKKLSILFLTLLLAFQPLMSLAVGPPLARFSALPGDMQQFLPEGYDFMDGILVEGGVAYLLFHNGTYYYLYILQQDSAGVWQRVVRSDKALPAGSGYHALAGDSANTVYVQQTENLYYTFSNLDGVWKLAGYFHLTAKGEVFIEYEDDKITFHDYRKGTQSSAYGVYQRELRYLNIRSIPFTLQEARATLSQVPVIPAGGMQAQRVKFTGGQRFPVYSGPGSFYFRAANGKAAVSTNDWIQVFGVEDGWALIQYDVTSSRMRIGYIDAVALPKGTAVPQLRYTPQPMVLRHGAGLTDDPLFSKEALLQLPEGQEVNRLDGIGTSWALVELMDGQTLIRGFVPENALMVKPSLSLVPVSPFSDTGEFAQYQAMAVVQRAPNGDIAGVSVYALLPQAWKRPAAGVDALVGYRLYEGNRASYRLMGWKDHQGLCVFRHDEGFATQADVLGLVPIYALSGEVAEESLMIPLK